MLASQPLDTHPPLDLAAFRDPAPSPARTHRAQETPTTEHRNRRGGRGRLPSMETLGTLRTQSHPPADASVVVSCDPPGASTTLPTSTAATPRRTPKAASLDGPAYPFAVTPPPQPHHLDVPTHYTSVTAVLLRTGTDGDEILVQVECRGGRHKWSLPSMGREVDDRGACLRAAARALWSTTHGRVAPSTCRAIEMGELQGPVHQLHGSPTLVLAYRAAPPDLSQLHDVTRVQGHATADPALRLGWLPVTRAGEASWCHTTHALSLPGQTSCHATPTHSGDNGRQPRTSSGTSPGAIHYPDIRANAGSGGAPLYAHTTGWGLLLLVHVTGYIRPPHATRPRPSTTSTTRYFP